MTGLEGLVKLFPILAVLVGGGIAYGEIKSDISNLQHESTAVSQQLDRLSDKIDNLAAHR